MPLPEFDIIGAIHVVEAQHEDTLLDIARRYDIGQEQITWANPDVDRWLPGDGTPVIIPTRYILPAAPRRAWCSTCRKCACTTTPSQSPAKSRW